MRQKVRPLLATGDMGGEGRLRRKIQYVSIPLRANRTRRAMVVDAGAAVVISRVCTENHIAVFLAFSCQYKSGVEVREPP